MIVIFLRHGEAEEVGIDLAEGAGIDVAKEDQARELTPRGRRQTRCLASALEALKLRPALILSSPLVRAQQTAEVAAKELKRAPDPILVKSLAPGHTWKDVRRDIKRCVKSLPDADATILLCGHQPDLGEYVLDAIIGSDTSHPVRDLPIEKSACICLAWDSAVLQGPGRITFALEHRLAKRIAKLV